MQVRELNRDINVNREIIKRSHNDGFMVTNIESYHPSNMVLGGSPASYFTDHIHMVVPYRLYDGRPLACECEVQHFGINGDLQVQDVELFAQGPDDIFNNNAAYMKNNTVFDASGRRCRFNDYETSIADCAAAAAQFPHVMTFKEYSDFGTESRSKFDMGSPTLNDYLVYLKKCGNEIQANVIPYVGQITTKAQIQDVITETEHDICMEGIDQTGVCYPGDNFNFS